MVSFIPVFFMCNFVSMRFSSWSQSPRSTLGCHSFSSAGPACFPHLQTALRIHNLAYLHALLLIVPLLDPSGESGKLSTFLEDFPPFSVYLWTLPQVPSPKRLKFWPAKLPSVSTHLQLSSITLPVQYSSSPLFQSSCSARILCQWLLLMICSLLVSPHVYSCLARFHSRCVNKDLWKVKWVTESAFGSESCLNLWFMTVYKYIYMKLFSHKTK